MQLCGTVSCPLNAVHVSSDNFAHHQELLNCIFTASGNIYVFCSGSPKTMTDSNVRMYYQKL